MFYYYDPTYLLLIPGILLALYAQFKVTSTFNRFKQVGSRSGLTGAQAARMILDSNGCRHVEIEPVRGSLTDHYDPENNVLRLSSEVYGSRSIAAIGVAAHEAGHAIQDAQSYAPLAIRANLVPVANIGSSMAMPLFFLGLLMSWEPLLKVGILCFAFSVLFYVVTLPVEFNASRRAVTLLAAGYLSDDEVRGVKAVLSAAALTYVAAALQAVLQLLRLVLLANSRRRDD